MSIKSITIENFKGIREPVKFELAPITLLYGPNSAGKSTLLQALAYFSDVINHQECNNQYARAGSTSMKLGGFSNIVNGHDLTKSIRFVFELDDLSTWCAVGAMFEGHYPNFIDMRNGLFSAAKGFDLFENVQDLQDNIKDLPLLSFAAVEDGLFVEFSISWDMKNKDAFVSRCRFIADNEDILTINAEEAQGDSTILFNFDHPYFLMASSRYVIKSESLVDYGWKSLFHCITQENSLLLSPASRPINYSNKGIISLPGEFENYGKVYGSPMRCYFSVITRIKDEVEEIEKEYPVLQKRLLIRDLFGNTEEQSSREREIFEQSETGSAVLARIAEIRKPLVDMPIVHRYINTLFTCYFDTVINGSFEAISDLLKDPVYIGPLRSVPDSTSIQQISNETSWHDGMFAWQFLNRGREEIIAEVNKYLSDKQYFNSGYKIKTGKVLSLEMEFMGEIAKLANQDNDIELEALRHQLEGHSQFKKILKLRDIRREVDVDLTDVGTGISQIVPIIVALLVENHHIVMVEQPELHIHPRLQVQLGELLVHSLFAKRNHSEQQQLHLLETHSEDLLLRLMRRIREPNAAGHKLTPEDLAIHYVDVVDGSTQIVNRIEIDKDGDFIDEWPGGFFEESYREKFAGR